MSPTGTVIVTSRDRWDHADATLDLLLARTDQRHRVVVVDGAAPPDIAAHFDRVAATGRVEVIRRDRYLATNEGRRIAIDAGIDTDWVALVENDVTLDDGWLDTLIAAAEASDAASAFPVYLQDTRRGRIVHGTGADLEITGRPGARRIREIQHHLDEPWATVAGTVVPARRIQAEPHCVVIRRDALEATGGPDPELLGWFEHVDLALHHLALDVESCFVPDVTCVYHPPLRLRPRDVPTFLLRWGRGWFDHSRDHMCARWGLDRDDPGWSGHERYRLAVRRGVLIPGHHRASRVLDAALSPLGRAAERRWFRARQREGPPALGAPRASRR